MRSRGFYSVLFIFLSAGVTGNVLAQNAPSDHFREGYELLQRYDTQRAIERFEQGLKIEPTNALAHYYLAEALWLTARTEEAREHYEQSLKLDANSDVAELARKKLQANAAPTKKPASTQNAQDGSVTIPPLSCQITTCICETKHDGKVESCNNTATCNGIINFSQHPTTIVGSPNNPQRLKHPRATETERNKGVCTANEVTLWATEATIEARYEYDCSCDESKGCKGLQDVSGRGGLTISRTSGVIAVDNFDAFSILYNRKTGVSVYVQTTERGRGECIPATAENRKF